MPLIRRRRAPGGPRGMVSALPAAGAFATTGGLLGRAWMHSSARMRGIQSYRAPPFSSVNGLPARPLRDRHNVSVHSSIQRGVRTMAKQGRREGGRRIVALDIDECLIHSTDFSDEVKISYRQAERGRPDQVKQQSAVESFRTMMRDGVSFTVLKRPGLNQFLQAAAAEFDVYTFTAGTRMYAEPLLDQLDPDKTLFKGRLYRTDCREVFIPGSGWQYLKDLTAITQDLHNVVLVDNNIVSFVCQPRNGILVPSFVGEPDNVLEKVLGLLGELDSVQDVRPHLDNLFKLEARLGSLRCQLLGDRN